MKGIESSDLNELLKDERIFIDNDLKRRLVETPRGIRKNVFSEDDQNMVQLYFEYLRGVLNGTPRGRIFRLIYFRRREEYD